MDRASSVSAALFVGCSHGCETEDCGEIKAIYAGENAECHDEGKNTHATEYSMIVARP
jgi:hypothetical protein